jgi:hypothetical protein
MVDMSPMKKRAKLSSVLDDEDTPLSSFIVGKGKLKKAELKRLEKERLRIEKKEAKDRAKKEAAAARKAKSESFSNQWCIITDPQKRVDHSTSMSDAAFPTRTALHAPDL